MSILVELIKRKLDGNWAAFALQSLERFARERYGARWDKKIQIRINGEVSDDAAPFAAFIPAGQPKNGPYGGMSFVIFPSADSCAFISLGIGTNGLSPDEQALGRPGHARKSAAVCGWLSSLAKKNIAWAKPDPVRIDLGMPKQIKERLGAYHSAVEKYEKVLYAVFFAAEATNDEIITKAAHTLCDIFAEERGLDVLVAFKSEKQEAREGWLAKALPSVSEKYVCDLLRERRFVVLEGPPGTGKTRLAVNLIKDVYKGNGRTIQFHPGTTYETFVGGLSPVQEDGPGGLKFTPRRGHLMEAAAEALKNPAQHYLLHIDEINRADLSKILGEAIFLFEPSEPDREVSLFYDFGAPFNRKLKLPANLHVLGTMNSADRSIAILDIAVRRRFAFVPLWPDYSVLEQQQSTEHMKGAFQRLFTLFLEEATNDAFGLMPGHAYFLDKGKTTDALLRTGLKPLLNEYLQQGYVSGFSDEVRAFIDWLDTTGR